MVVIMKRQQLSLVHALVITLLTAKVIQVETGNLIHNTAFVRHCYLLLVAVRII